MHVVFKTTNNENSDLVHHVHTMTCACRDRGLSNTTGPGVVRVTTIDGSSLASILKPETSNNFAFVRQDENF
ncbi:hypothetical protein CEXT_62231 [Caerostris extrusa]|uniref:Uncharacterized protein n=1 Tax=Caerostris extrusa TaxID=172846 RepID=A0AAV4R8L1_CAEEX|nr:hypothetical protein CEXT_62231 [Caerostris extrusa]